LDACEGEEASVAAARITLEVYTQVRALQQEITGKSIGWLAQLPSLSRDKPESGWCGSEDSQELLRHANSRITLDIYTRAISATEREANNKVMEMVIEAGKTRLSAPSRVTTNLATAP
jgi:hypothetical protein